MKRTSIFLSFLIYSLSFFISNLAKAQYTQLTDFTELLDVYTGAKPHYDQNFISDGTFLYGMTSEGGINNMGTIFKIMPDGTGYLKLLDFNGTTNGSYPQGSLYSDGTFLYGMTNGGGTNGMGTIFKIKPDGTGYIKLLDFAGATNGSNPQGSLISDGTFLYGMTLFGGINSYGTIFKIMPDGSGFSKLLDFAGSSDGNYPHGSLFSDGTFLYGMTANGGTNNMGTIFKIMPDGTGYAKLLDFNGSANGKLPQGTLVSDGTFLYGMSMQGGVNNTGAVFKILPDGTGYTKLLDIGGGVVDGQIPWGSIIFDGTSLYGITSAGGANFKGTIFKVNTDGTGYAKLLDFDGAGNGKDPRGSLFSDGTFLYGMVFDGGTYNLGTAFKIKPDGTEYNKLLDFANAANGSNPNGALVSDGTFLYGMTSNGGANSAGTIFKIMPDGTGQSKLFDFDYSTSGSSPQGSLIFDGTFLYGMTTYGGANSSGTIFKIMPDGTGYAKLLDFAGATNGSYPYGTLYFDGTFLYGMTNNGGVNNMGTIFKIMPDGSGYTKLLDFNGTTNGNYPKGSLISDGTFLYGMTSEGGTNYIGTIFKIMPDGTGYAKLLDFDGTTNGSYPYGTLYSDGTFLYGLTNQGGTNDLGTAFKIMSDGTQYAKLLDFDATNGFYPQGSALISDGTFLYGMATYGGANSSGTIFKIMPDGTGFTTVFDFVGGSSGKNPYGSLLSDGAFFYGMTNLGGSANLGTVFKYQYCGSITSTTPDSRCGTGTVTLGATSNTGTLNWYTTSTGGASIGTGNTFITPSIDSSTIFYVDATISGCISPRTAVLATVKNNSSSITNHTACDSYTWNGNTYTNSGTIDFLTTNAEGCDSVATLNLTINTTPSAATTVANETITATENGATYQWIDCNTNQNVANNGTSQTYTATTNGSYQVMVTKDGCSATSTCVDITTIDVSQIFNVNSPTLIYPNPANETISIKTGINLPATIIFTDVLGKKVLMQTIKTNNQTIDVSQLNKGVYSYMVSNTQNENSTGMWVKN